MLCAVQYIPLKDVNSWKLSTVETEVTGCGSLLSVILPFFSAIPLYLYIFFTFSYVWPLNCGIIEGRFCWGLIINWPEVTLYYQAPLHIIQGFGSNEWRCRNSRSWHNTEGKDKNMVCYQSALNPIFFQLPVFKFIFFSMWVKRKFFYLDQLTHSNPLMI